MKIKPRKRKANDMLKMRTALEEIAAICDGADTGGLDERTAIYNIAKAALADATIEVSSVVGNMASLREAMAETQSVIEKCLGILNRIPDDCGYWGLIDEAADELCYLHEGPLKSALSVPDRKGREVTRDTLKRIHQLSINLRRFLPSRRWRWMSKRDREELLRGLIWIGVECRTALSDLKGEVDNEKSVEVD